MVQQAQQPTVSTGEVAESPISMILSTLRKFAILYFVMNFLRHSSKVAYEPSHHTSNNNMDSNSNHVSSTNNQLTKNIHKRKTHQSLWPRGAVMDLHVYFSQNEVLNNKEDDGILAEWSEYRLTNDNENPLNNVRAANVTISLPNHDLANNVTELYAHVHLELKGMGRQTIGIEKDYTILKKRIPMVKFKRRQKKAETKRLLGELEDMGKQSTTTITTTPPDNTVMGQAAQNKNEMVILSYIKPTLHLDLVDFQQVFQTGSMPPQITKHLDFCKEGTHYYPLLYPNEFWLTTEKLVPINGTLSEINVEVGIQSKSVWLWQMMSGMEEQWKVQASMNGGDDSESDIIRTVLLDTNPFLLIVTGLVSLLHTAFDFLAFKNDISFFKGKKSMEGLSLRTMVVNGFFSLIIFLYLLDNETSYMVLMSNGVGVLIEFWKISKAIKISFHGATIRWEEAETYKKSKTKEYDEIATNHLLFVTMPLVAGYGLYSLFHMKHKGWYSWFISTLVGFIYMFGFVMMTPQLFINYKLKSVAHLNWRTMTYKSLNTFIDDLFAFVIKMPLMHRLACFRDDIIFLIFLYQRHIYKTDYSRVNEYGQQDDITVDNNISNNQEEGEQLSFTSDNDAQQERQDNVNYDDSNGDIKLNESSKNSVLRRRGARDHR